MPEPYRKKLIEVALPLEAIDAACKADKDRKTGTIRNAHKWFAPMPVPAWRALLFAALVDDPEDATERERLRLLIEALVASGPDQPPAHVLSIAREEIARSNPNGLPTIVDPFCGGGSTLVEAQRLGLHAWGSDLNPVPVLISRTLCELLPAALDAADAPSHRLHGPEVADVKEEVMKYAEMVGDRVRATISDLYAPLPGQSVPYAWIWARTAVCPNPACRLRTPLLTSWCLSAKAGNEVFARPVINEDRVCFEITDDQTSVPPDPKVGKASFACVRCDALLTTEYLRQCAREDQLGTQLVAVAAIDGRTRTFLAPSPDQEAAIDLKVDVESFLRVPIGRGALGIQVSLWGMTEQADLYLPRQIAALTAFASEAAAVYSMCTEDGVSHARSRLIASTIGLAVSRLAMSNSKQVKWFTRNGPSKADPALREANLPIVWTFVETNPFAGSVGDWLQTVETTLRGLDAVPASTRPAHVEVGNAREVGATLDGSDWLVATDPPYFSHIGYADLSDYFYVWLRRALRDVHPDLFQTIAAPRAGELVANPAQYDGDEDAARSQFVEGFTEVFESLARVQRSDTPMLIVYAHREHEGVQGWEAMLSAIIDGGLQIVGTWPIEASRRDRLRTQSSNAMAAYVVLVCRPRESHATRVPFREFDHELRRKLRQSVRDLQEAATAPVDLAQAVIGPGMAVYSQNAAVLSADGSPLDVGAALAHINRVLASILDEQEADFDAETRFAVTWFDQHGTLEAAFGEADLLARAKNVAVNGLVEAGILESRAGRVRLLGHGDLDPQWDPERDTRVTVWEITQHLVRRLQDGGEEAAADLLRRIGRAPESARELAYRLYAICERKGWPQEALGYNALVVAWPEMARLAAAETTPLQARLEI